LPPSRLFAVFAAGRRFRLHCLGHKQVRRVAASYRTACRAQVRMIVHHARSLPTPMRFPHNFFYIVGSPCCVAQRITRHPRKSPVASVPLAVRAYAHTAHHHHQRLVFHGPCHTSRLFAFPNVYHTLCGHSARRPAGTCTGRVVQVFSLFGSPCTTLILTACPALCSFTVVASLFPEFASQPPLRERALVALRMLLGTFTCGTVRRRWTHWGRREWRLVTLLLLLRSGTEVRAAKRQHGLMRALCSLVQDHEHSAHPAGTSACATKRHCIRGIFPAHSPSPR